MRQPERRILPVLRSFLLLGLTSFGGPVAHLGYFRAEFVARRRWLDDATFAEIVALCSALPGPTSSQVGMLIGAHRAGPLGALAAWAGFTAPSALALTALGVAVHVSATHASAPPVALLGAFAGLAAAAGGVIAHAVVGLFRALAQTARLRAIAFGAVVLALAVDRFAPQMQWLVLAAGAAAGAALAAGEGTLPPAPLGLRVPRVVAATAGAVLVALIVAVGFAQAGSAAALFGTFFRAGALVFGGGHVVLPFLATLVTAHEMSSATFLAGYGAAQAVPGPLFTFAAFLGAANDTSLHGIVGAAVAVAGIFLPSFLLLPAALPVWTRLRGLPRAASALAGINASVVGLLAAVLAGPVGAALAGTRWEIALAVAAFLALTYLRTAPWLVVAVCGLLGLAAGTAGIR